MDEKPYGPPEDKPLVEDDDLPVLLLVVVDPGNDIGAVIHLIRTLTGMTPAETRDALRAGFCEVVRAPRMEIERYKYRLEKLGATVSVTEIR